jgi:radical SAM superfamily enzyme YgiQ (UPF0313 family)
MTSSDVQANKGTRRLGRLKSVRFPDADGAVSTRPAGQRLDVLLVNPPSPDGGIWIRTQHRVGRRSRENMIWPQVSLAQMAALLEPDYSVEVVDAIAGRMSWPAFEALLRDRAPRYYLTQATAPTLTNDMYGVFLARSLGARTLAFGTHVTPMVRETLRDFPALDFVLRGEPELTLRELIDTLEATRGRWRIEDDGALRDPATGAPPAGHELFLPLWKRTDPTWAPPWGQPAGETGQSDGPGARLLPILGPEIAAAGADAHGDSPLAAIAGLGWRHAGDPVVNRDRPFFPSLDDLPVPAHRLLPLDQYRAPLIRGPYSFVVTSRGCPAGCSYCIKHVSYGSSVRLRSPRLLVDEIRQLVELGARHIHMYADLFTVNREQVVELCRLLIEEGPRVPWTCNSRVDYVDEEMLELMGRAGCELIAWGIESANEQVLKRAHKGYPIEQAHLALTWARRAGIKSWGYFIIGLPGETESSIRETVDLAKRLPLDIALFHVAAPYPGTPFFFDVVENGWFREGTRWEEVDMDQGTVIDYPDLSAEDLLAWQRRAFREWAFRPGPLWTFVKSMNSWSGFKSALDIGLQTLGWVRG